MRKTKILATMGPASSSLETITKMIEAGMDAARINFSHGDYDSHEKLINTIKEARKNLNRHIPLILDTKGPEIRTGLLKEGKVYLEQGSMFTLTTEDCEGDKTRVRVDYENLPNDLHVGSRVLIDDGLIEMKVVSLTNTDVNCVLLNSGFLGNRKGVNVPDSYIDLPSLTEKDIKDLQFGIRMGIDWISASFVRKASDIVNIRKVLEENGGEGILIIAKIESRDGVNNIAGILEAADGIMVARGDLGVEILPEEVPNVQKELIRDCNLAGKPVITATHMLESMVNNPRPTRAEANDVANAIYDGSDVVMLSGETANGKYPVEAISMMARIATNAEEKIDYSSMHSIWYQNNNKNITNAISYAAVAIAMDMNASCIVPITDSGFAARMVSSSRPSCPIVALTADERVCRQLSLSWGCVPMLSDRPFSGDSEVFDLAEEYALKSEIAKNGEIIVSLAGVPVGVAGTTNTIRVCAVGDVLAHGEGNKHGVAKGLTRVFDEMDPHDSVYFEHGDIVITSKTDDSMMEYIKKAGALVVGPWDEANQNHVETVAMALNIPLLRVDTNITSIVKTGIAVTVDTDQGFLFNGYR